MAGVSTIPQNFVPLEPQLKDLLDLFGTSLMANFNCHHLATIQIFNPLTQTATATINYQRTSFSFNQITQQFEPTISSYPILIDCPVIVLGGGTIAQTNLTFPISTGDQCLVLFNDRDIDSWYSQGPTASVLGVNTARLHSFSDGIIIVGLHSRTNPILSYDSVRAMLRAGAISGTIAAVGVNPVLSKVLITNTYPTNVITLNTLLQQLITEIQNLVTATSSITVTSPVVVPATPFTGTTTSGPPNNAATISAIGTAITVTATAISTLLE